MMLAEFAADSRPSQWSSAQYQLLDFGAGRKLERFGQRVLDRVCPAAEGCRKAQPSLWSQADLVLSADGSVAVASPRDEPSAWQVVYGNLRFQLKRTPFGHVGLFPEQAVNWRALSDWVQLRSQTGRGTRALNLFAYTGGTTLALCEVGAQVVHVDASAPAVAWARANAELSRLSELPVRWIVEDARKFVRREIKRGNRYDLVVLDPPSFGHGPKGQRWEIGRDVWDLLDGIGQLLEPNQPSRLLLTAHCHEPDMRTLGEQIGVGLAGSQVTQGRLHLQDLQGRRLDAGFYVNACM